MGGFWARWFLVTHLHWNMTGRLQPADVVLNKPLKHAVRRSFMRWIAESVFAQLSAGKSSRDVSVDLGMKSIKGNMMRWLFDAWKYVRSKREMVMKGWAKCGLLDAFLPSVQDEAQALHNSGELFGPGLIDVQPDNAEEPEPSPADLLLDDVDSDVHVDDLLSAPSAVDDDDAASHEADDADIELEAAAIEADRQLMSEARASTSSTSSSSSSLSSSSSAYSVAMSADGRVTVSNTPRSGRIRRTTIFDDF